MAMEILATRRNGADSSCAYMDYPKRPVAPRQAKGIGGRMKLSEQKYQLLRLIERTARRQNVGREEWTGPAGEKLGQAIEPIILTMPQLVEQRHDETGKLWLRLTYEACIVLDYA